MRKFRNGRRPSVRTFLSFPSHGTEADAAVTILLVHADVVLINAHIQIQSFLSTIP